MKTYLIILSLLCSPFLHAAPDDGFTTDGSTLTPIIIVFADAGEPAARELTAKITNGREVRMAGVRGEFKAIAKEIGEAKKTDKTGSVTLWIYSKSSTTRRKGITHYHRTVEGTLEVYDQGKLIYKSDLTKAITDIEAQRNSSAPILLLIDFNPIPPDPRFKESNNTDGDKLLPTFGPTDPTKKKIPAPPKVIPAIQKVNSQKEAIALAASTDIPLLKHTDQIVIIRTGKNGVKQAQIISNQDEIHAIISRLSIKKVAPSGGIPTAHIHFSGAGKQLRKIWLFSNGEWGFNRAGTQYSISKNKELPALLANLKKHSQP